jgi:hypothetical protein
MTDLDAQETAAYAVSRAWLDGRIAGFWETLPPLAAFYADSANARTLVLAYGMTAAAAIALHRAPGSVPVDPEAHTKCVSAARALLACFGDTRVPDCTTAHPVIGALCATACRVLMAAVHRARAFNFLSEPGAEEEAAALAKNLKHGITIMRMYAVGSPLIREWPGLPHPCSIHLLILTRFRIPVGEAAAGVQTLKHLTSCALVLTI